MHTRTRTDASRAPTFLLITIISASPSSGASSAPSATQKSDASRAASPPDRQKRGDSEVRLEEKKERSPRRGLLFLDVAGEFKVIRAVVMVSIDVYRPITSLIYLEVVHISYAARYSGLKVVFFFGVTLVTSVP